VWVQNMNVFVMDTEDIVDEHTNTKYYKASLEFTLVLEDTSVLVEDTTPPSVTVITPSSVHPYTKNQVVKACVVCSDDGGTPLGVLGHHGRTRTARDG
jgi:hypothetical protein